MKYRFLYIIICIAFLSFSVEAKTLIDNNFERSSNDTGNFTNVVSNKWDRFTGQSSNKYSGSYGMYFYNPSTGGGVSYLDIADTTQPITTNFMFMTNSTSYNNYFYFTPSCGTYTGETYIRFLSGEISYLNNLNAVTSICTSCYSANTWYNVTIVHYSATDKIDFWLDGTNKLNNGSTKAIATTGCFEPQDASGTHASVIFLDDLIVYNYTKTNFAPPDTTPPSFGTINQNPSNLTIFNAIVNLVRINVSITDGTAVNTSSVKLNLNVSKSARYINGTYYTMKNQIISYNNTASNIYHFWLDESDYLSATYNIKHEWFENTTHVPYNLTSATSWIKTRFFNVSSKTELAVVEYYDSAMTSTDTTKVFYYCNSSYVSGKPTTSPYCTQFWSGSNQNAYDHTHVGSKSKHKMYPLGIDTSTGTINGIGVTNTSYILKKGTDEGETVWYINRLARTGTTQTSTNNGVTWTSQTWTVDSHLHQVYNGSTLTYNVCASDTLGNKGCATTKTDLIDFTHVNPSVPLITSPVSGNYSDDTLNITYTASIPTLPCVVNSYKLYYKKSTSSTWTYLLENYPNLNYVWDISGLDEGNYNVRVNVTDTCSQKVFSLSDTFEIDFVTESELLLSSIDSTLDSVYEVLNMIPIIMMYFGLIAIGYWFSQTGNHWVSLPFLFASTGISFYLWKYYDGLEIPEIGLMFAGLTLGSVIMWIFLNSRRVKTRSEIM